MMMSDLNRVNRLGAGWQRVGSERARGRGTSGVKHEIAPLPRRFRLVIVMVDI